MTHSLIHLFFLFINCFTNISWASNVVPNTQPPPPPPPANTWVAPPLPPPPPQEDVSGHLDANVMSEEEKTFDIQFKEWETKFQTWKDENKNHPDKVITPSRQHTCLYDRASSIVYFVFQKALAVYEAQWKTWREQLIQNREKLRKQRVESVVKQNQLIAQSKHEMTNVNQQVIGNNEIRANLQYHNSSHLQPQMPILSGQPLILPPQHNSFSSRAPNSSTHLHPVENSKLHNPQCNQNKDDGERNSSAKVKRSSFDNLPEDRLNHQTSHFHQECRDQRMLHSTADLHSYRIDNRRPPFVNSEPTPKQPFSPLLRASHHLPGSEFQDARQIQPDIPPLRLQNRDHNRDDVQHFQPVLPANNRPTGVPQRFHPPTCGTQEPPRNLLNFVSLETNNDEDLRTLSSESSSETATSLFRKRAMRGKGDGQRFVPYKAPDLPLHLDKRAIAEPVLCFEGGVQPRIAARLAENAEIKFSALSKPLPTELRAPLVKVDSLVLEPIVFEYNHRPGKRGRFAEPITIEYAHAKPSEIESSKVKITSQKIEIDKVVRSQNVAPVSKSLPETIPVEQSPVKSTPLPLFPSAAAIQLEGNSFPKPQLQLLPDQAMEGNSIQIRLIVPNSSVQIFHHQASVPCNKTCRSLLNLILPLLL